MKKTFCVVALTLTGLMANSEIAVENTTKIDTMNKLEIVKREIRTSRMAPENRGVLSMETTESQSPRLARAERMVRENREVDYVATQTNKHLARSN